MSKRSDKLGLSRIGAQILRCTVFLALWVVQSQIAAADLLWLVDREEPVAGVLVEENEESVRFRFTLNDVENLVDVPREDIKELVVTLDQERLAKLSPQNVTMYLDYAEELAGFSRDEYAIATARQMALIAARLSTGEQRSSAFRLLISLCEGQEKRNVERLAFLYDLAMALPEPGATKIETMDTTASETLVEVIRMIRRDHADDAAELLEQDRVTQLIEPLLKVHANTCSLGDLRVAAKADSLTVAQLAKLLQLERALVNEETVAPGDVTAESWFAASGEVVESNQMLPEFENVLDIDPRLSIFRDGVWVAPTVDP